METDAGAPDAGVPDAGVADAGLGEDAGVDAGFDAGRPALVLTDYVPCNLDIECPSGLGRCLKILPLHHPDVNGALNVATSTVFPSLAPGQGICAESCEQDPATCQTSSYLSSSLTFSCQLVYAAPSPYPSGALDAGAMRAGDAFAAICRPPLMTSSTCASCATDQDCAAGRCWDFATDAPYTAVGSLGSCVNPCSSTGACALGFACVTPDAGGEASCLPTIRSCTTCVDVDRDRFGFGFCGPPAQGVPTVTAVDCDDREPATFWQAPLQCGAVDHDCNGRVDSTDMVGTDAWSAQHCSACNDACPSAPNTGIPGLEWQCLGPAGMRSCVSACAPGLLDCDPNPDCEVSSTSPGFQFAPDVDGDGFACNPSSSCVAQTSCAVPAGYAAARTFTETVETCSNPAVCPDANEGADTVYPGALERCDGLDNDQEGTVDDGFLTSGGEICTNGLLPVGGTCPGSTLVLAGAACSVTCGATTGPGTWTCSGTGGVVCAPNTSDPEIACNAIDDNCNGAVDEPLNEACDVSAAPAGTMDSPCWQAARRDCMGVCVQAPNTHQLDPDVPNDGFDADCDGMDTQSSALYVYSGSSVPLEAGTRTAPYKTLTAALANLNDSPTRTIYLQDALGVPVLTNTTIPLGPGVRIYGGFKGALSWTVPPAANPERTTVCMPPGASVTLYSQYGTTGSVTRAAYVGLTCNGSTVATRPAVLRNVTLQVNKAGCGGNDNPVRVGSAAAHFGWSVYGAIFRDCDELVWRNVAIDARVPPAPFHLAKEGAAGQTGASGLDSLSPVAGGAGGAGASGTVNHTGTNGSSTPPTAPANLAGGAGGPAFLAGNAPTTFGARGAGGAVQSLQYLVQGATPPSSGVRASYYFSGAGQISFSQPAAYLGSAGLPGDIGFGGGGGGIGFGGILWVRGGKGGQGGGGGLGGEGGAAGGDCIGLVLLGTQLPPACTAASGDSACGESVSVTAQGGAAGGGGAVAGQGGSGGGGAPGVASTLPSGAGGQGGKGCGGGGGAGGRGGATFGLAGDERSIPNLTKPSWLTVSAAGQAAGGLGGGGGVDGASGGSYSCAAPSRTAADGRPGRQYDLVLLPVRGCSEVRSTDTDFTGGAAWTMNVTTGDVVASTCP